MLELILKNDNLLPDGASFFITSIDVEHSDVCNAPPSTVIGTEIKGQGSFTIGVCQRPNEPPIASGVLTLSTLPHGGELIGIIRWQFSGTMDPIS